MGRERNSNTLNPEIKKIRLGELEMFCNSEMFRHFLTVPITPSRAASYIDNPDGMPEDVVLVMALINGKLVAFRSLFAGVVFSGDNKIRFGWCSGSWVDPEFRRQGLSQFLLKEAYNDWSGRLMFTNYAPESESLYMKTGWFKPLHQFKGARAYLLPKTARLFPKAKGNAVAKVLFFILDFSIAAVSHFRILFYNYQKPENVSFKLLVYPDEESIQFIEKYNQSYLFNPRAKKIKWILNSPWISDKNRPFERRYPFSSCSESFYYRTVKLFHNNELAGVCLFSVREGHLKTLFFWLPQSLEADMANFLKDFIIMHKLEMFTVYHQGIAEYFRTDKFPFLHIKSMGQKIYSSFDLRNAGDYNFQDGDGDRAFT